MTHPLPWTVRLSKAAQEHRYGITSPCMPRYYVEVDNGDLFEPNAVIVDDDGNVIPGFDWLSVETAEAIVRATVEHRDFEMHEHLMASAEELYRWRQDLMQSMRDEIKNRTSALRTSGEK